MKDPSPAVSRLRHSLRDRGWSETISKVKGRIGVALLRTKSESAASTHQFHDQPDLLDDQLEWPPSSGLTTTMVWQESSTAVIAADKLNTPS